MTKQRNLGLLIPQFPGQTHIFFWREIKALEKRGVNVRVFSTRLPPAGLMSHEWTKQAIARTTYLGQLNPWQAVRGVFSSAAVSYLPDARREGGAFLKDLLISAGAARALKDACKNDGIEHVHVHSCGRAALVAALARRMGGPDYSLTLHGPLSDYGVGQRAKWRDAAFAAVITQKLLGEMKSDLPDALPERLLIQPMGVDTEVLKRPSAYHPPSPAGPIRLFSCGRLNIVKGRQDLLRAVRKLIDQGIEVKLKIAGEDDDGGSGFHKVLDQEILDLGLSEHVELLGAISADAVREHLFASHIFVLASWHEPLGVAYMEAMSCGVPTIGTRAGGVPELITDGVDGIMVPPKSPEDLATAILDLSRNPETAEKLSQAGRTRIESAFHSDIGAETLIREIWG